MNMAVPVNFFHRDFAVGGGFLGAPAPAPEAAVVGALPFATVAAAPVKAGAFCALLLTACPLLPVTATVGTVMVAV